jgi:hypothetical protein
MIFIYFINLWPARYLNDLWLQCSVLNWNLKFFCLLTIRIYPLFHFNFFITCCSVKIFRNPFFIFYLDKHHPVWLIVPGETTDVDRDTHIVFPFHQMSSCTPMWVWEYSRGLFPILPGVFNFSAGWNTESWLYFPCIKVGKMDLYSSFWTIWCGMSLNRDVIRSTIIPELCRWLEMFSLAIFV